MRKSIICAVACLLVSGSVVSGKDHSDVDDSSASPESMANPPDLVITTTPAVDGFRIKEYRGVVRGVTVRQPTVGQGLSANLERMGGGKISAYQAMADRARQQSLEYCIQNARKLGANAIVGLAYDSTAFTHGDNVDIEVACYGTAVIIERDSK